MANRTEDLTINIKAKTEQAERAVGELERDLRKLDDTTLNVGVKVKNGRDIDELVRKADRLDRESADVLLKTNAKAIEGDIRKLIRQVDKLDADDPTITAHEQGIDALRRDLARVNDEIDKVNRKSVAPDTKATSGKLGGLVSKFTGGMAKMAASAGLPADQLAMIGVAAGAAAVTVGRALYSMGQKFSQLGVQVGKFADATGVTTEFASRLIEVTGDIGIGADAVEGAIGKMNKTLGKSPGAFAQYGVEVAKAKDGTTDVEQTFLNVIKRLQEIPDAGQRAATGAAIFGKSWAGMAELVMTDVTELKGQLDSVSDAKVFTRDEVERARKWREAMDSIGDAVEDLQLNIGKMVAESAPELELLGKALGAVVKQLEIVGKIGHGLIAPWEDTITALQLATGASDDFATGAKDAFDLIVENSDEAGFSVEKFREKLLKQGFTAQEVNAAIRQYKLSIGDVSAASKTAGSDTDDLTGDLDHLATKYDEAAAKAKGLADAQLALIDGSRSVADQERVAVEAISNADEARAATVATMKDQESTLADLAQATQRESDAGITAAQQVQAYSDAMNTATGGIVDATDHVDSLNASLIDQATKSSPAARASLVHYIAKVNDIPPEKETEILALLNEGKVEEANRVLNETSETRKAAVNAEAHTKEADKALDDAAKTRTARINVELGAVDPELWALSHPSGAGPPHGRSASAPAPVPVPTPVGLAVAPTSSTMTATVVAPAPLALQPPVLNTTVVVQAGIVTDAARLARAMMRAQRRTQRLAGSSWAER